MLPFSLTTSLRQDALLMAARLDLAGGAAGVLDLHRIDLRPGARSGPHTDEWVLTGRATDRGLALVEAERAAAYDRAEQLRQMREASLGRRVDFSPGWREQGVTHLRHGFERLGSAASLSLFVGLDWPDADQELVSEHQDWAWVLHVTLPKAVVVGYLGRWQRVAWLVPTLVQMGVLVGGGT